MSTLLKWDIENLLKENKERIDEDKWTEVYNWIAEHYDDNIPFTGVFTDLFLEFDVNPLYYMKKVPDYYAYCGKTKKFIIPSPIQEIGYCAFYKNNGSELEINITSSTLKSIGQIAFRFSSLRNIEIPRSVEKIGQGAFADTPLSNVTFQQGSKLKILEPSVFMNTQIEKIELPEGIDFLPPGIFLDCGKLKEVTLPKSLKAISSMAFQGDKIEHIHFNGTEQEFDSIEWQGEQPKGAEVICTDETFTIVG